MVQYEHNLFCSPHNLNCSTGRSVRSGRPGGSHPGVHGGKRHALSGWSVSCSHIYVKSLMIRNGLQGAQRLFASGIKALHSEGLHKRS